MSGTSSGPAIPAAWNRLAATRLRTGHVLDVDERRRKPGRHGVVGERVPGERRAEKGGHTPGPAVGLHRSNGGRSSHGDGVELPGTAAEPFPCALYARRVDKEPRHQGRGAQEHAAPCGGPAPPPEVGGRHGERCGRRDRDVRRDRVRAGEQLRSVLVLAADQHRDGQVADGDEDAQKDRADERRGDPADRPEDRAGDDAEHAVQAAEVDAEPVDDPRRDGREEPEAEDRDAREESGGGRVDAQVAPDRGQQGWDHGYRSAQRQGETQEGSDRYEPPPACSMHYGISRHHSTRSAGTTWWSPCATCTYVIVSPRLPADEREPGVASLPAASAPRRQVTRVQQGELRLEGCRHG